MRNSINYEENESLEQKLSDASEIFHKYPHPLEGSTFFEEIGNNIISTNFFPDCTEKGYVEESDILKAEKEIQKDIDYLKQIKEDLLKTEEYNEGYKKMLIRKINEGVIGLYFLQNAVRIEAEKGGYELDEETKDKKHHRVQFLSTALYGPEISNSPNELKAVKEKLQKDYQKNHETLPEEEKEEFINFLEKISGEEILKDSEEKKEQKEEKDSASSKPEIKKQKIDSQTLKQIFKIAIKAHGIDDNIEIRTDKNFIDIGENGNYIPDGKKYTLERATKLLDHEISTHLMRSKNHSLPLRSAGYIKDEEGFAIMNERLVDEDFENLYGRTTPNYAKIFAAENLDYNELFRFIYLYNKLTGGKTSNKDIDKAIRRKKRYHPYDRKGANRKDVVYSRGFKSLLEQFNNMPQNETEKLYDFLIKGKFAAEDKEIFEKIGIEPEQEEFIRPVWIGKIVDMKLRGEKVFFDELKEKDFRFKNTQVTENVKREIVKILKEIRPDEDTSK